MKKKYYRRTKILLSVFIILFILTIMISNVYVITAFRNGNSPIEPLSGYYFFTIIITTAVYLPLMLLICYNAKKAVMPKTLLISRIITGWLLFAILLMTFSVIVEILR